MSATSNAEPDPNYYYGGPGYYHGYYSPGFKQYPSYYHNQVDTSNLYTFTGPATTGKGWSPKFATGLNVIIGIDQKIYERADYSFAKMVYS